MNSNFSLHLTRVYFLFIFYFYLFKTIFWDTVSI